MKIGQISKALAEYEARLLELEAHPVRVEPTLRKPTEAQALNHALWMCVEVRTKLFQEPGVINQGKINRWLGFIQATLWMQDLYTIDDLKTHNR